MRKALVVLTTILLLSALLGQVESSKTWSSDSELECHVLYFFNGIVVYNSTITETLILETPRNTTLPGGFTQSVEHLVHYNLLYNETTGLYEFNVEVGRNFTGFFVSRVELCARPMSAIREYLSRALQDPRFTTSSETSTPSDVREAYVKTPSKVVVERVVPAYESWFKSRYGISTSSASSLGLAVTAAYFIYLEFIEYEAGTTPRSIEEVVETRRGDCDDMSRVLVELLNYYEIPALMVYGYPLVENFSMTIPVENVTYKFINNGPHAFTLAYIAGLGWISLDFLAGSLILRPAVVESYARETATPREQVESFLELHRALSAVQVIAIFTEESIKSTIRGELTLENLYDYFTRVVESVEGERGGRGDLEREVETTSTTAPLTTPLTTSPPTSLRDAEALVRDIYPLLIAVVVLLGIVSILSRRRSQGEITS
ncbi:MAG: transglutaminase family protein [Desulfurococcaceae archaeon]|nr:transglutaminase family protein [Desulfurococcaceae archaeon]